MGFRLAPHAHAWGYFRAPSGLANHGNDVTEPSCDRAWHHHIRITQYETAKGTFCIDTKVAPYVEDKQSGHGGAGPATCLAFFGEDGDGKFESMEYSTVVMGDPNRWRLHVPKWASGPSSNN